MPNPHPAAVAVLVQKLLTLAGSTPEGCAKNGTVISSDDFPETVCHEAVQKLFSEHGLRATWDRVGPREEVVDGRITKVDPRRVMFEVDAAYHAVAG